MDHHDPRWGDARDRSESVDRDWGGRAGRDSEDGREHDPRDAFTQHLYLPRGAERELVVDRERVYELSGRESRALAATGAFRVTDAEDLRGREGDANSRRADDAIQNLRESGLVETMALDGRDRKSVV